MTPSPLHRITALDHAAMLAIARRRHPFVTLFLQVITWSAAGYAWGLAVIVLALGIYFDQIHFPYRAFTLRALGAAGLAWLFVQFVKRACRRRRPFQALQDYPRLSRAPLDDSFPSGHTASAFAFLIAMLPLGPFVTVPIALWATIVGFSRFYLGVHFPTDIIAGAVIGSLAGVSYVGITPAYANGDRYPSYVALAGALHEGKDFVVDTEDRSSEVLVLAIHGGNIEPGSAELAGAIAGKDWSRYIFRALRKENASELHVTSTHFDDPRVLKLAEKSRICLSIHGYLERTQERVCLGGGNTELRQSVERNLRQKFPDLSLKTGCKKIAGVDPKNIVNRCRSKGVQLELSSLFRDRLLADPSRMAGFAATVREAMIMPRSANPAPSPRTP